MSTVVVIIRQVIINRAVSAFLEFECVKSVLQWNTWSRDEHYNKDEVASGFQNFLICIEMFFAALAHAYAFPPRDYMDPGWAVKSGFVYSLKIMFNVRDVVDDVEDVVTDTVGSAHASNPACLIERQVAHYFCLYTLFSPQWPSAHSAHIVLLKLVTIAKLPVAIYFIAALQPFAHSNGKVTSYLHINF